MKRTIFTIFLFLLLGAIVNVAVAWGNSLGHQLRLQLAPLMSITPPTPGPTRATSDPPQLFSIHNEQWFASRMEQFEDASTTLLISHFRSGWPLLSLHGAICTDAAGPHPNPPHTLIRLGGGGIFCLLPVVPLWPGFIVNTLFYALILWLLIPGPFILRRHIRVKRGCCPKCGYDLRGAPSGGGGCPECGWNRASQPAADAEGV